MPNSIKFSGSLHSHGCWTDYRNPKEKMNFPFDLEKFAKLCLGCGRDFQAITDIMASWPGMPEFQEHRHRALLDTARKDSSVYLEGGKRESIVYVGSGKLVIPRTQEILTDTHFKHILAVGTDRDIRGGRNAIDTLKEIKDTQGYCIIDHPFMCSIWQEGELLDLHDKGMIDALEWNGGLTWPAFTSRFMKRVPSKRSNLRAIGLESRIPVVANDDAHSAGDIKQGAYTTYFIDSTSRLYVDRVFESVRATPREFRRHEQYSGFFSPVNHVRYGSQSQKMFGNQGLPDA